MKMRTCVTAAFACAVAALAEAAVAGEPLAGLKIVQLDLARQMETCAFVSNYIDRVSAMGYDTLELYLEARVATPTFSLPKGECYSLEEMRDLVGYAAEKGMTVVPVVSLLGHAEQFFAHPGQDEYLEDGGANVRLGNGRNTFCLSNPGTREFLSKYVADLCTVFVGPYFHAGFDEAWNSGTCPRCHGKELRDEAFSDGVLFAHGLLKGLGKRMWMWDDFFPFHPKALARMPKDIVMCHWNYDADISDRGARLNFAGREREDMLATYARLGFDAIPCCWNKPDNARSFVAYASRHRPFGFMMTQWEMSDAFHGGMLPRVLACSLLMKDPARYRLDDAFVEACRRTFPSLSAEESLAACSLLGNLDDPLAVAVLRKSALTPAQGTVDADPFSERALLDDLVMRAERAQAAAKVAAAERILADPRRTAAESEAACGTLNGLVPRLECLAARRREQMAAWRPACSPAVADGAEKKLLERIRKAVRTPAVAAADEKLLEVELSLIDYYGWPSWKVFGRFGGDWREIAAGSWKPAKGDWAAFTKRLTFRSETLPEAVRLEQHGFGEAMLRYVSVSDRSARVTPWAVSATSGRIRGASNVLKDDYSEVTFGTFGFLEAFYDKAQQDAVSSLTVELK